MNESIIKSQDELNLLKFKNRLNLLNSREKKENGKIVKKLERQIRNLESKISQG